MAHMSERPDPDMDHVREAMREHDERVQEDEERPAEEPDPEEEPDDPSP